MTNAAVRQKLQAQEQTIGTMRLLLAACVRRFGVFDRLDLKTDEIAAVQEGTLKIEDRPDGTIVLRIKNAPPKLVLNS